MKQEIEMREFYYLNSKQIEMPMLFIIHVEIFLNLPKNICNYNTYSREECRSVEINWSFSSNDMCS